MTASHGTRAEAMRASVGVYEARRDALVAEMRAHPANALGLYDVDALAAELAPCLRMATRLDLSGGLTGRSRIGGEPDMPVDAAWPTAPDGEPMTFVGQVAFGDLPPVPGPQEAMLPTAGLLSVFIAEEREMSADTPEAAAFAHVRVLPAGSPLVRRAVRAAGVASVIEPLHVDAIIDVSVPGVDRFSLVDEQGTLDAVRLQAQLAFFDFEIEPLPHHQLLGHHPDMVELRLPHAEADGIDLDGWRAVWGDVPGTAEDWTCVWRIDSDPEIDLAIGDAGSLYLVVPTVDLMLGTFERALVVEGSGG